MDIASAQAMRPVVSEDMFQNKSEKNWAEPPAGHEARKVTGDQIGKGGERAPLQRDIPVS